MNSVSELWSTSFGILISLKVLLFFGLLLTARTMQSKVLDSGMARPALIRFGGIEALLMAAAVGIGVALTQTAYPAPRSVPHQRRDTARAGVPAAADRDERLPRMEGRAAVPGLAILGVRLYVAGVIKLRRPRRQVASSKQRPGSSAGCSSSGPPTPASRPTRW